MIPTLYSNPRPDMKLGATDSFSHSFIDAKIIKDESAAAVSKLLISLYKNLVRVYIYLSTYWRHGYACVWHRV